MAHVMSMKHKILCSNVSSISFISTCTFPKSSSSSRMTSSANNQQFFDGDDVVEPTSGAAPFHHSVSNHRSDCINSNHSMQRPMNDHQTLCYLAKKCQKWRKWCTIDMVDMVAHVTQHVSLKNTHTQQPTKNDRCTKRGTCQNNTSLAKVSKMVLHE